ncbi:hypothetical protein GCM10010466_40170 [Planomonospora alba]|uniref:DUF1640 domain-containing protein n=1 Tax=Planomonospora alba TaxID=161354 RepID=A0ABP6NDU5_9ACTN
MNEQPSADVSLALAELRRLVEVGFERTSGQTALILQRLDHVDGRHAELAEQVRKDRETAEVRHVALENRLDAVEREAVTSAQLADRTKQIIAIVTVLVTTAGVIVALISLTKG